MLLCPAESYFRHLAQIKLWLICPFSFLISDGKLLIQMHTNSLKQPALSGKDLFITCSAVYIHLKAKMSTGTTSSYFIIAKIADSGMGIFAIFVRRTPLYAALKNQSLNLKNSSNLFFVASLRQWMNPGHHESVRTCVTATTDMKIARSSRTRAPRGVITAVLDLSSSWVIGLWLFLDLCVEQDTDSVPEGDLG